MSKTLNLEESMGEITRNYARKIAEYEDSGVYAYLKGAIDLLSYAGEDITDYTLIRVNNPMQYKDDGVAISSQYRIVPISDVTNLPETRTSNEGHSTRTKRDTEQSMGSRA